MKADDVMHVQRVDLWDAWWAGNHDDRERLPNVLRGFYLFMTSTPLDTVYLRECTCTFPETRQKISQSQKGTTPWNKGLKHT